jgi:hypothetical protein
VSADNLVPDAAQSGSFWDLAPLVDWVCFFPGKDKLMRVARILVAVIECVHYPVNHYPARNATRDLLSQLTGWRLAGRAFNTLEVFWFFSATLSLSLVRCRVLVRGLPSFGLGSVIAFCCCRQL